MLYFVQHLITSIGALYLLLSCPFVTGRGKGDAQVSATPCSSELNAALGAAIESMNQDGFLDESWLEFYGGVPIPVPSNCMKALGYPRCVSDSSDLGRVLNTGVVRIGIARVAAAFPIIYTTIGDDPTKLDLGSLSGIEIEEAREAVRRISDFYDTPIEIEFVIIEPFEGDVFFGPLSAALLAGEIDLTWSRMGVTAERAQVVDFSCINFATNFVLATNSLDTSLPTDEVKVGCVALLCSLSFPPNFTPEPFGSLTEVNNALANGIVSYISGTAEQLALFFAGGTCNDCKIVEGVDLGGVTWAPATRPIPVEVCDEDEGDYYMYSPKRGKKGKKGKHMIC